MPRSGPLTRSQLVIGGAIAAVTTAAALVGMLAWHASSLNLRDGVRGQPDVGAIDAWATSSGYIVVSRDEDTRGVIRGSAPTNDEGPGL